MAFLKGFSLNTSAQIAAVVAPWIGLYHFTDGKKNQSVDRAEAVRMHKENIQNKQYGNFVMYDGVCRLEKQFPAAERTHITPVLSYEAWLGEQVKKEQIEKQKEESLKLAEKRLADKNYEEWVMKWKAFSSRWDY